MRAMPFLLCCAMLVTARGMFYVYPIRSDGLDIVLPVWRRIAMSIKGKFARAIAIVGLVGLGVSSAGAGELQDIRLRDGSVIRAEIVGLKNGVYTLRSPSLGTMRIEQGNVVGTGRGAGRGTGSSATPGPSQQIDRMRNEFQTDPKTMQRILSLKQDPAMRRLLNDPKVMDAIRRGDLNSLAVNPDIKKLMGHPVVRDLLRRGQ